MGIRSGRYVAASMPPTMTLGTTFALVERIDLAVCIASTN